MPSTPFVVALGIGTVFLGLIGLVILCKILSVFFNTTKEKPITENTNVSPSTDSVPKTNETIENRQEIIAAVSAVLAEELGTDVSALRILSFKKI